MCGRYTLTSPAEELYRYFNITDTGLDLRPRYNIAPSQLVPAVVAVDGVRHLDLFRWGLLPAWAKDEKIGYSTINARAETVDSKPIFRSAFRHRRCLIPADGFYEWQATNGHKQPWRIVPSEEHSLFAFAGLWESWQGGGRAVHSCTIIVGEPNTLVRKIHDRMPVILEPESFTLWLDDTTEHKVLKSLLKPLAAKKMKSYRVSEYVNNPRHDDSTAIQAMRLEGQD